MRRVQILTIVVALLSLLAPSRAHGYIDPSTGSYLLQILMAGLIGVLFALKMFWHRLRALVSNLLGRSSDSPPDDA